MPRRLDDPSNNNWRPMWESNKNSHRLARAWLQRLSSSPSLPVAPTVPFSTSDSSNTIAMSSNLMIQSSEDQFLHWHQDMEKKQKEQARKIRELEDRAKHLQCENDRLWAQVEKRRDLGKRDVLDSGQARHPTASDKENEPIVLDDVDTLEHESYPHATRQTSPQKK